MRILLFAICVSIFITPTKAKASYWVVCSVIATVEKADLDGVYSAKIKSAVVVDGHDTSGSPCMKDNIGKIIDIAMEADVPAGNEVRLKYQYFNFMTQDGSGDEETWSYWPWSVKEILPW